MIDRDAFGVGVAVIGMAICVVMAAIHSVSL